MLKSEAELTLIFQALADPTRRAIVDALGRGPASVSDLARPFEMSLPAIVQHLQTLEQAGLVRSQKQGRTRTCTLDRETLSRAETWINSRRLGWEARLDRLGPLLDSLPE